MRCHLNRAFGAGPSTGVPSTMSPWLVAPLFLFTACANKLEPRERPAPAQAEEVQVQVVQDALPPTASCPYDASTCTACLAAECSSQLDACAKAHDPQCRATCKSGAEPSCYFKDCRNWSCASYCEEAAEDGHTCHGPVLGTWRPPAE